MNMMRSKSGYVGILDDGLVPVSPRQFLGASGAHLLCAVNLQSERKFLMQHKARKIPMNK